MNFKGLGRRAELFTYLVWGGYQGIKVKGGAGGGGGGLII